MKNVSFIMNTGGRSGESGMGPKLYTSQLIKKLLGWFFFFLTGFDKKSLMRKNKPNRIITRHLSAILKYITE